MLASQDLYLQSPQDVTDTINGLNSNATDAAKLLNKAAIEQWTDADTKDKVLASLSGQIESAMTTLSTDVSAYSSFVSALGGIAGTAGPTLAQVLHAKAILESVKQGGVIFVNVHFTAGRIITKRNITTVFGATRFYASPR